MSRPGPKIAIVGATGAVGREMLSILESRRFPVSDLVPFASARSEGKPVRLNGKEYATRVLAPGCFKGIDIAFFDASDAVSKEWVPAAAEEGAWVIDNSAAFRLETDVPLAVPEVNAELIEAKVRRGVAALSPRERIIAGPNCTTVQLVVALKPVRDRWGLKRVVVSSYQATSGAGTAAMDELTAQTRGALDGRPDPSQHFSHGIAFNCIPHIGGFKDDGYTSEEHKIMAETRKILGLPGLRITATSVRVPIFAGHGEAVTVETDRALDIAELRAALAAQPGVIVQDEPARNVYPMSNPGPGSSVEGAAGRDAVYVGRIRRDPSVEHGFNVWVVSDNLRKGAALNAIQIGELLIRG